MEAQHLIRRFGYAGFFVVPARLGKGGWLFPFLARTLTLPDDVELLGARHGRNGGHPPSPAQIPACSFPAPGSSAILASAIERIRKLKSPLAVMDFRDARPFNPVEIDQRPEGLAV